MSARDPNSATETSYLFLQSRRSGVYLIPVFLRPQILKMKLIRKHCCCCANSFFFWTNGTSSNSRVRGRLHNVMETVDFSGKPFPCPICNMGLRIKISRKQKPYCMCLECGIQIFFRGQTGIKRLYEMIQPEEAVAAEFNGPARAIFLYNRLQGLKRQKESFEDKKDFFLGMMMPKRLSLHLRQKLKESDQN